MSSSPKPQRAIGFVETLAVASGRCHFSVYRNVAIGVWLAQADREAAETALGVSQEMAKRFDGLHSSVAFLVDGIPGPLPEAMPALTKLWARRPDLACTGVIIEGGGFWASGLRSMINNTRREGGGEVPVKIGNSIADVVDWLSTQNARLTGVIIEPSELAHALSHARKIAELSRTP